MAKKVVCPGLFCKSIDVSPVGVTKKAGLVKGAVGSLINPVVGVAGLLSGKKEATFRCNKCGRVFTVKL